MTTRPTDICFQDAAGRSVPVSAANPLPAGLVATPTIDIGDVTLLAGSAIAGQFGIDQTTPGTTNAVAPIAGQNGVAAGAGAVGATVQRTTLASDDPLVAKTPNHTPVSTASLTALASSASSAQLLAANASRKGLILTNTDVNSARIKYGATASATSFTVEIPAGAMWEMPLPIYTGQIDAIWDADGSGSLYSTEL